jgi:hypothetical protein
MCVCLAGLSCDCFDTYVSMNLGVGQLLIIGACALTNKGIWPQMVGQQFT